MIKYSLRTIFFADDRAGEARETSQEGSGSAPVASKAGTYVRKLRTNVHNIRMIWPRGTGDGAAGTGERARRMRGMQGNSTSLGGKPEPQDGVYDAA